MARQRPGQKIVKDQKTSDDKSDFEASDGEIASEAAKETAKPPAKSRYKLRGMAKKAPISPKKATPTTTTGSSVLP